MLVVSNLRVSYGATEILSDVSFAVNQGSVAALLGGNGSGKTTLLNTISGLVQPRAGSIRLTEKEIARSSPRDILRAGLSQVPQGREVFPSMSVFENLRLGGTIVSQRPKVDQAIERVFSLFPALRTKRNTAAGHLSGGEQQQLAIGRALISGPKLLLMDEPSAGLSPIMVDRMIDAIKTLRSEGLTIVLVEQNVGVAAAVAEDAFVLRDGRIAHSMKAESLLANENVLSSYLGK